MKKVFVIIACVLVVLLPTIFMVGDHFYSGCESAKKLSDIEKMVLKADGITLECDKESEALKIFSGLHGEEKKNRPTALTVLPEEALSYERYEATYLDAYGVEHSYVYYLSSDSNSCYFTDAEQRVYKIASESAGAFLDSDFSEAVYAEAKAPVVSFGGKSLVPYTLDWHYKTAGGQLKTASCSYADRDEKTFVEGFNAIFSLDSSVKPDEVQVVIREQDTNYQIYAGGMENLSEISIEGSKNVYVDLTAYWKQSDAKGYYGEAKYYFSGRMFGTPAFSLSKSFARCGEVLILSAYNVVDPNEIQFTSEPELGYTPQFYKVGESWQALIPLKMDLVDSETAYTLRLTSSTATDILLLTVSPFADKGEIPYSFENAELLYTDEILKDLNAKMMKVLTADSAFSFAGGKFVLPAAKNYVSDTSNYSFGMRVRIVELNKTYIAYDNMYCATTGGQGMNVEGKITEVHTAFDGKVVFVGEHIYTGRMVIVDHGSGLMTWYTNLSSDIAVSVGDSVTAGQFLSHAADGGLNSSFNFNFHVGASVYGVPVELQKLIENGLIAENRLS